MRLYIDTRDNKKTIIGLDGQRLEKPTGPDKSQQVLLLIDQILKKEGKSFLDITEVRVETGPGSFTGLRVGISVANAFAWTLGVLVNGQKAVQPKYE